MVVVHLIPSLALPLVAEPPTAAPRRPVPYWGSTGSRAVLPGLTASVAPAATRGQGVEDAGQGDEVP
ncbi:exported hypothetical protein [Actinacidiphila cocklensis]|uniref:Uncharacterized protein n=1 Tax=Actinacidiphila cocklensis TaxID=887465 RepID=A0A9W4DZ73_9ACTN|nr:exported hypothetical protein [Actinacidiphila cocklensis]